MALTSGTKLGPYEIQSPLGAGGMGEVYRARDTRLDRSVAIKILSAAFSADCDRLDRFEQEARSASALNHPNIVTIYELGQDGSTHYIAMELVEGKTLRELLVSGLLPMRKAIEIAAQVAEGLTKACQLGVSYVLVAKGWAGFDSEQIAAIEVVHRRAVVVNNSDAVVLSMAAMGCP